MHVCIYVCIYVCKYECMQVRMYVCVCYYVHTYMTLDRVKDGPNLGRTSFAHIYMYTTEYMYIPLYIYQYISSGLYMPLPHSTPAHPPPQNAMYVCT